MSPATRRDHTFDTDRDTDRDDGVRRNRAVG
jgi:hypothetical protein